MTERFMVDDAGELIDLNNHKFVDYGEECCNLLNELHEEKEMWKRECRRLKGLYYLENEYELEDIGYYMIDPTNSDIGKVEMMDKEVTVDLNELDINIQKGIIFKSDLNAWIERKMDYYEGMMEKTDGSNYVNAKGHLDMLVVLKEWINQR